MFKKIRGIEGLKCGKCEDSFLFVITNEMRVECAYCGDDKGSIKNRDRHIQSKEQLLKLRKTYNVMHCAICFSGGGNDYTVNSSGPSSERLSAHCSSCGTMINEIHRGEA